MLLDHCYAYGPLLFEDGNPTPYFYMANTS